FYLEGVNRSFTRPLAGSGLARLTRSLFRQHTRGILWDRSCDARRCLRVSSRSPLDSRECCFSHLLPWPSSAGAARSRIVARLEPRLQARPTMTRASLLPVRNTPIPHAALRGVWGSVEQRSTTASACAASATVGDSRFV